MSIKKISNIPFYFIFTILGITYVVIYFIGHEFYILFSGLLFLISGLFCLKKRR